MDETNPKTRDFLYKEHLMPLKARISSIMLYDSDSGIEFLNKYNELLKKMDDLELGSIMAEIADLEFQIGQYESNKGKEELADEKGNIILNNILDLLSREEELSTEDFEEEFLKLKDSYSLDIGSYDYSDADAIESRLYQLQASLLMRKIREEGLTDLHDEIKAEDVSGLTLALNTKINGLMENPSQEVQERVDKIKMMTMDRADAVYDTEVWRMLDDKTRESPKGEIAEQKPQKIEPQNVTALVPVREKKRRFKFPNLLKIFKREKKIKTLIVGNRIMELQDTVQVGNMTVNVKELSKIDMEYLASIMPEEMLRKYEESMLEAESREGVQEKYLPDPKALIYSFMQSVKEMPPIEQFNFINENGNRLTIQNELVCNGGIMETSLLDNYGSITSGYVAYNMDYCEICSKIMYYAEFIDKITNGNLLQQLKSEIGIYLENAIKYDNVNTDKYTQWYVPGYECFYRVYNKGKLPILENLRISYFHLNHIVQETKFDFKASEQKRREEFYKTHSSDSASRAQNWREELKAPQSETMKPQPETILPQSKTMEPQAKKEIEKQLVEVLKRIKDKSTSQTVEILKKIQDESESQTGSKNTEDEEIEGH